MAGDGEKGVERGLVLGPDLSLVASAERGELGQVRIRGPEPTQVGQNFLILGDGQRRPATGPGPRGLLQFFRRASLTASK